MRLSGQHPTSQRLPPRTRPLSARIHSGAGLLEPLTLSPDPQQSRPPEAPSPSAQTHSGAGLWNPLTLSPDPQQSRPPETPSPSAQTHSRAGFLKPPHPQPPPTVGQASGTRSPSAWVHSGAGLLEPLTLSLGPQRGRPLEPAHPQPPPTAGRGLLALKPPSAAKHNVGTKGTDRQVLLRLLLLKETFSLAIESTQDGSGKQASRVQPWPERGAFHL